MKKNNIIISSYDDIKNPFYGGGGAIALHEIAKRLTKTANVQILSWNHSGIKKERIDGVSYRRIGFSFLPPKLGMLLFQLSLPVVAAFKTCDVWVESFGPPFTTSMLPLFTRKKVIGIVHMLAAEDMQRKYHLPFHHLESFGMKRYQNVITTSVGMKEAVARMHPGASVSVISNGVHPVPDKKTTKQNNILFIGRIEVNQKGLDLLIKAFKKLCATDSTTTLLIAGSGLASEMTKLQSLIKQTALEKRIILLGRVSGEEKDRLFRQSRGIVIPSRFETYSLTALEAMAYGLPIIAFDIQGLSWVDKNAGIKVPTYDTNRFAKAMKMVLAEPKTAKQMGVVGKRYASQFSWENIGRTYVAYMGGVV